MRCHFAVVVLLLLAPESFAISAYPDKIEVKLSTNECATLFLHGDENCKWATTEDGYTLLPVSDGWVYAQEDKDGYAVPSSFYLSAKNKQSKELKSFLSVQNKNILVRSMPVSARYSCGFSRMNLASKSTAPIVGRRKALVILIAFKDLAFHKNHADFEALFNQKDYRVDGAVGSVRDYFLWASYGQLDFTCDILGPYVASNNMSYYGGNVGLDSHDKNPFALFKEAIELAAQEVDLANYDSDNDGYVDNVHVIFSGYGEESGASSNAIWSHEMTFDAVTVQGMKINKYSCAPELRGNSGNGISRIGSHCHEMGHALGAMDYYDTDYAVGGNYEGTGNWDIMASGSWNNEGISPANFNPYVRIYDFGWVNVKTLPDNQFVTLYSSSERKDEIYRLNTSVTDEFYLIENRSKSSFDEALPGEGLLIFHIGAGMASKMASNKINATYPQECYVVCASSETKIPVSSASSYGNINNAGCPFPGTSGKTSFSDSTRPSALCQGGEPSGISLSKILLQSDGAISLYNGIKDKGEVIWQESFEDGNFLSQWECELIQRSRWFVYDSSDLSSSLVSMPKTIDGKCYLCMQYKDGVGEEIKAISRVNSKILELNPYSVYTLSLQYQLISKVYLNSNAMKIYYRNRTGDEWSLLATCNLENKGWIETQLELPVPSATYQLSFEGEISLLSSLFLDNLQIFCKRGISDGNKEIQLTDEKKTVLSYRTLFHKLYVSCTSVTPLYIYDMCGHLYYTAQFLDGEEKEITLPPGFYILSCEAEQIKIAIL
ncbi:M6 family metalloprotease domain-containing protein [Bacteroides sp.]